MFSGVGHSRNETIFHSCGWDGNLIGLMMLFAIGGVESLFSVVFIFAFRFRRSGIALFTSVFGRASPIRKKRKEACWTRCKLSEQKQWSDTRHKPKIRKNFASWREIAAKCLAAREAGNEYDENNVEDEQQLRYRLRAGPARNARNVKPRPFSNGSTRASISNTG